VVAITHFSKTATQQPQRGKNDAVNVLHSFYSVVTKLQSVVCLGGNIFSENAMYLLSEHQHVHSKNAQ